MLPINTLSTAVSTHSINPSYQPSLHSVAYQVSAAIPSTKQSTVLPIKKLSARVSRLCQLSRPSAHILSTEHVGMDLSAHILSTEHPINRACQQLPTEHPINRASYQPSILSTEYPINRAYPINRGSVSTYHFSSMSAWVSTVSMNVNSCQPIVKAVNTYPINRSCQHGSALSA